MRQYFGYIRVSTIRQGVHGVSLQEQREAIERCATRQGVAIAGWFEEKETAAKRGRAVFGDMLKRLSRGQADGIIIHKIDRSARNLRDWADLGELIDKGVEVIFANESLDLSTRGGRLSADIQAVVASDYIRNLREETKKGIYGRLKQGFYPFPAPYGYQNCGAGQPKQPDPITAPLIRQAFELYATGGYNLFSLSGELHRLGLRSKTGKPLSCNSLSIILNNPFYMGLMRIEKTNETFIGRHEALIDRRLFERVRQVCSGKLNHKVRKHDHLFRRLFACKACGGILTGELQKGHVYYRCHCRRCHASSVREEAIGQAVEATLAQLSFSELEQRYLAQALQEARHDYVKAAKDHAQAIRLRLDQVVSRLDRLTDALLEGLVEKDMFELKKTTLLVERRELEDQLAGKKECDGEISRRLNDFFELSKNAYLTYKSGLPDEKRELIETTTSNRAVQGKNVGIYLKHEFQIVAEREKCGSGATQRDVIRTMAKLVGQVKEVLYKQSQV